MKQKNFTLSYVVYPFDIMFSFGETDKELFPKLRRMGIKEPEAAQISGITTARTVMFAEGPTIVRLKWIPRSAFECGVLHHEIFHAVHFLLSRISIELCEQSGEAFAYLIQYLTEQVYKRI